MNQKGMTLIEMVIAFALLGLIGTAIFLGLSAGILGTAKVDERTIAGELARSQMEYIQFQPYIEPPAYSFISPIPNGYSISIEAIVLTPKFLQSIKVIVSFEDRKLIELESYKASR